ncbi:MAG: HAMP domain-containing protein [Clostridia bacterium]|nr:HAMP domain-containing protein [Clostridia bacterium]
MDERTNADYTAEPPVQEEKPRSRLRQGVERRYRLSLSFTIALHYCRELAGSLLLCALIATLILVLSYRGEWQRAMDAALQPGSAAQVETVRVEERLDGGWWQRLTQRARWARERFPAQVLWPVSGDEEGTLLVPLETGDFSSRWLALMAALVTCDLARMLIFLRHRRRLDKRVLAPIRDMTELAATISANNLDNRLNEEGIKNELRDLAVVINGMLDRIERSYNSQKQFVSDASHELRTPIAVIQGYADMLRRWGKDDPEVLEEGLNGISQETRSMKELVENLLFLARHDKRTMMLEKSRFDPNDLLREMLREVELVNQEDHFAAETTAPCEIEADRSLIKQVMRILLDNAIKYTPAGGHITLGAALTQEGCVLSVQDDGPGIPSGELPKIFDRFYRVDSARSSETSGYGLGLSIARIIVVAHGGKLRVRSKVGEGSTFEVLLPDTSSQAG